MTRFERKIVFAAVVVALLPFVASLFLVRLVVEDSYRVGINEGFEKALVEGVDAHREQLRALRESSERAVDAIAVEIEASWERDGPKALESKAEELLQRYEEVAEIKVFRGEELLADVAEPLADPAKQRRSQRTRSLPPEGTLEVVVTAPTDVFDRFQEAGEVAELYSRLYSSRAEVSTIYVVAYATFSILVLIGALVLGVVLARRVTKRVAALARATRQVGAGDLTVTIPTGTHDEVTELTQAFNEMVRDLRESRVRIEYLQRISAWQDFARRLAHEIKNPLTPIQLAAQEMDQTYKGDDETYRQKLQNARHIIEEEVATLRRLVGEFSAFAKLPEAQLVPSDLREFVLSMESSIPAILGDIAAEAPNAVTVEIKCATDPLPVRMDPMMLKRCLDNLLRNAAQSVHGHGSGKGRVVLECSSDGRQAIIEVRDDGPGVPVEQRERIFDPYFTTKKEGTGLGLAIVKKVILEHSGEITLCEAAGGGACFRIELPLLRGAL